jgi:PAS domain S-box-containing protein
LIRLINLAEDGIVVTTADGRIVLFTDGAERMFGWTAAEVLGRHVEQLLPDHFVDSQDRNVLPFTAGATESQWTRERVTVHGVRKDRVEFPAEVTLSWIRDGEGLFFCAVVRDVTERRRAKGAAARTARRSADC